MPGKYMDELMWVLAILFISKVKKKKKKNQISGGTNFHLVDGNLVNLFLPSKTPATDCTSLDSICPPTRDLLILLLLPFLLLLLPQTPLTWLFSVVLAGSSRTGSSLDRLLSPPGVALLYQRPRGGLVLARVLPFAPSTPMM